VSVSQEILEEEEEEESEEDEDDNDDDNENEDGGGESGDGGFIEWLEDLLPDEIFPPKTQEEPVREDEKQTSSTYPEQVEQEEGESGGVLSVSDILKKALSCLPFCLGLVLLIALIILIKRIIDSRKEKREQSGEMDHSTDSV